MITGYKTYYFIGIGGIGMSALARYFKSMGKNVAGYDKTQTKLTQKLEDEGIEIVYDAENMDILSQSSPDETLIVYTPAVPKDIPLYHWAESNGYTIKKRSAVLGEITQETQCIAVAGTHGKTTTSTLLGHLLYATQFPVSAFLGGVSENYHSNYISNGFEYTVVEADEYDRSFLQLHPTIGIITSMDADHLDIYGDDETVKEGFIEFAKQVSGALFIEKKLEIPIPHFTYGIENNADYEAINIRIENDFSIFDLNTPSRKFTGLKLRLPGKHNIENAVAALAVSLHIGANPNELFQALENFEGIHRRFTRKIYASQKVYIDDYAHHPTEIQAALTAVRALYPSKKILGVFQPHLYSRTRDFADGFASSFSPLDELLLLDIYPAREKPIEGITSDWLADKIQQPNNVEVCSLENALAAIQLRTFDVIVTLGAGNIDILCEPIHLWLNEN